MLRRLLLRLGQLQTDSRFTFSIVVLDNDSQHSAEPLCLEVSEPSTVSIAYGHEPRKNIAAARNAALSLATGDYVAFIDDDEFPDPTWLLQMINAVETFDSAGILGPVRPHFDAVPPRWLVKGKFCERPEHPSGRVMAWPECRTGNLFFRREIVAEPGTPPFDEQFDTGGEDVDFFKRMMARGHVFRWCNEAIVHETVPPDRWTREYMLKRAILRGRNTLKLPGSHVDLLARSLIAVPAYSLIMPFALVLGQHVFMKYCIRFCDHAGRLLAAVGLNPVDSRH
jgi:succinoglycan biosynthesis protein ExoM